MSHNKSARINRYIRHYTARTFSNALPYNYDRIRRTKHTPGEWIPDEIPMVKNPAYSPSSPDNPFIPSISYSNIELDVADSIVNSKKLPVNITCWNIPSTKKQTIKYNVAFTGSKRTLAKSYSLPLDLPNTPPYILVLAANVLDPEHIHFLYPKPGATLPQTVMKVSPDFSSTLPDTIANPRYRFNYEKGCALLCNLADTPEWEGKSVAADIADITDIKTVCSQTNNYSPDPLASISIANVFAAYSDCILVVLKPDPNFPSIDCVFGSSSPQTISINSRYVIHQFLKPQGEDDEFIYLLVPYISGRPDYNAATIWDSITYNSKDGSEYTPTFELVFLQQLKRT